jgi:hypothetical protein
MIPPLTKKRATGASPAAMGPAAVTPKLIHSFPHSVRGQVAAPGATLVKNAKSLFSRDLPGTGQKLIDGLQPA